MPIGRVKRWYDSAEDPSIQLMEISFNLTFYPAQRCLQYRVDVAAMVFESIRDGQPGRVDSGDYKNEWVHNYVKGPKELRLPR